MSDPTNRYYKAWESFWSTLAGEPGEVLWNVSHDRAVAVDFERFQNLVALDDLPLVDVGCGDGTQTTFLADRVRQVIGVDVSPSAIAIAKSDVTLANLEYDTLDILDRDSCEAFHQDRGDVNAYTRTVLMQFLPEDRPRVVDNLQVLLGKKGHLYLSEYTPEMKAYYDSLIEKEGMPLGFSLVLKHGITPGGISSEELKILFPEDKFEILQQGRQTIKTAIPLASGGFAEAPAFYLVLKSR
ncbi:MAG: class I SAM-dependent methyltransferase [Hormoscilla sp.]